MQRIIIEEEPAKSVVQVLNRISSDHKIKSEWAAVAKAMGVKLSTDEIKEMSSLKASEVLTRLLEIWHAKVGRDASILQLSEILDICGLTEYSQCLRENYYVSKQETFEDFDCEGHKATDFLMRTMAEIGDESVVGRDISINTVVDLLMESPCRNIITYEWCKPQEELNIQITDAEAALCSKRTAAYVFDTLLSTWVHKAKGEATIGRLKNAFHCTKMMEFASRLSKPAELTNIHKNLTSPKSTKVIRNARTKAVSNGTFKNIPVKHSAKTEINEIKQTISTLRQNTSRKDTTIPPESLFIQCKDIVGTNQLENAVLLHWKGQISVDDTKWVLRSGKKLKQIYFEYVSCNETTSSYSPVAKPPTNMNGIKISKFPLDHGIVTEIANNLEMSTLQLLEITETPVSESEAVSLSARIIKHRSSLETIVIGEDVLQMLFRFASSPFGKLQKFRLDGSIAQNTNSADLRSEFCMIFPTVQHVAFSNVHIDIIDIPKVFKCQELEYLQVNVDVPRSIDVLYVESVFRSKPESLVELRLGLFFEILDRCDKPRVVIGNTVNQIKVLSVETNCGVIL